MRIISSGSWGALGNASNVFSAGGVQMGRGHSTMMIPAHHKLQQFLPNSWFWIKSQNIHSAEETKPNPISEPSCSKLLWNFKSWRISVFLLWRNVLSTCFLELLIKICHAVINSFKNVTFNVCSNPHQGRGSSSFALQGIFGSGKDRESRESSSGSCSAHSPSRDVQGIFGLLHPINSCSHPESAPELDLQWQCPRFSSLYLFLSL